VEFFEVIKMIYVTVGTQKFQFNRLLKAIDELVASSVIHEDVFMQTGYSTYIPEHCAYEAFLSKAESQKYMKECSLLIVHGGVATIMEGIKNRKPIIAMPRNAKLGEHVDDHQMQIVESLSAQNLILKCDDIRKLGTLIEEAGNHEFNEYVSKRATVISTIREYICGLSIGENT
jgi:UDP-N-acetylglucosamine transferase subunit ALG13